MKKALFHRGHIRRSERGVTMILVAVCMVAIVAMAALSIDVVTLYLARMEAQRTADAAALAAAKVISLSGITGDPNNTSGYWAQICGNNTPPGVATQAAQAAAAQVVDNVVPTVTVTYSAQGSAGGVADCSTLTSAFAINPTVIVQVSRSGLPTLFSRIWGRTSNSVSATAMAEAFNPSNSGSVVSGGQIIPVQPRCVKPWMIPNLDPLNPSGCTTAVGPNHCQNFVSTSDGHIMNPGISLTGNNANGVIGEQFWLASDCVHTGSTCTLRTSPEQANFTLNPYIKPNPNGNVPNVLYLPGQAPTSSPVAVPPAASGGSLWEQAIAGCDQSTVYECGVATQNTIDLSENPQSTSDIINGVEALIRENNPSGSQPDGQDYLNAYAAPSSYPFQILAGSSNPYLTAGSAMSGSSSIVTVPIYDSGNTISPSGTSPVTIVGFLQVFINAVDQYGNVNITVLNVSGCGNGSNATGTAVAGSSPVPIRLISQ